MIKKLFICGMFAAGFAMVFLSAAASDTGQMALDTVAKSAICGLLLMFISVFAGVKWEGK